MQFVNPYFLFGFLVLAIPIVIHLFNFRKFRNVYFTNVRFLREVQQETQARSKLKHLLVLISRILALSFLVFAFAQPYLPRENMNLRSGDKVVSIWVDNSFSMDAINKSGTLLDEAKKNVREIALAYKPSDRFQLLTNDFEGRHQRLVSREELLQLVDEIKPSPAVRSVSEVMQRQRDVLMDVSGIPQGNRQAFLLSDFQKSIVDLTKIKPDTSIYFRLLELNAQNRNNIFIDSVWFTSPVRRIGQQELLHVRIRSRSEQDMENVPMRLYLNGEARTPSSFSIKAGGVSDTIIAFTVREPGLQQGLIEINDYPVTFDDRFWFSFEVSSQLPVMMINADGQDGQEKSTGALFLQALFGRDSSFAYNASDEGKLDYGSLAKNRFIVLNSLNTVSSGLALELNRFVKGGGSLFIFPGSAIDMKSYETFLTGLGCNIFGSLDTVKTIVDRINYSHPLYTGVFEKTESNIDLPVVYDHYRIGNLTRTTQTELLRLRNGDLFCAATRSGQGIVYLSAVPIDPAWSNFPRHAIFVPTLYQAALNSQLQRPLFYTISDNSTIDLGDIRTAGDNVFHLTEPSRKFDIIPAHSVVDGHTQLDAQRQLNEPGNYLVSSGNTQITGVAFNYNRRESDLTCFNANELEATLLQSGLPQLSILQPDTKGLTNQLTEQDYGTRLWKFCIWMVLLFLLCEIVLLRFWRTTKNTITTTTQTVQSSI